MPPEPIGRMTRYRPASTVPAATPTVSSLRKKVPRRVDPGGAGPSSPQRKETGHGRARLGNSCGVDHPREGHRGAARCPARGLCEAPRGEDPRARGCLAKGRPRRFAPRPPGARHPGRGARRHPALRLDRAGAPSGRGGPGHQRRGARGRPPRRSPRVTARRRPCRAAPRCSGGARRPRRTARGCWRTRRNGV
jgi:hypothetical protein